MYTTEKNNNNILKKHFDLESAIAKYQEKIKKISGSKYVYQSELIEFREKRSKLDLILHNFYKNGSHAEVHVVEDTTGHSCEELFGKHLDDKVEQVLIYETYLSQEHQFKNLKYFVNMLERCCENLKFIGLVRKFGIYLNNKGDKPVVDTPALLLTVGRYS